MTREKPKNLWLSRWGFILAATGSAVGLGNIWKFPYITGEYGGGAFVLMYLACILAIGIPVMMTEIALGRRGRGSPLDAVALAAEIEQNRQWLAQFTAPSQLVHFCYPSGEYQPAHLPLLQQNGVQTATTTRIGLHKQGSDLLQIRRILDGEDVHWLELEAELSGFSDLVRRVLGVAN